MDVNEDESSSPHEPHASPVQPSNINNYTSSRRNLLRERGAPPPEGRQDLGNRPMYEPPTPPRTFEGDFVTPSELMFRGMPQGNNNGQFGSSLCDFLDTLDARPEPTNAQKTRLVMKFGGYKDTDATCDEDTCVACMERQAVVRCTPCMHVALCVTCAREIRKPESCVLCRGVVHEMSHVDSSIAERDVPDEHHEPPVPSKSICDAAFMEFVNDHMNQSAMRAALYTGLWGWDLNRRR